MMRNGDKLAFYSILGQALKQMVNQSYQLLVVGGGNARQAVEREFAPLGTKRIKFLGAMSGNDVATALSAAEIFLWPAINEAYGMAILEDQEAGLPVFAGDSADVGQIIRDGKTGILTKEDNIK